jgi:hypothetical protein
MVRSGVAFALSVGIMALGSWLTDNVSDWLLLMFVAGYIGTFVTWGYGFFVGGRLKWREIIMRRRERAAWRASAAGTGARRQTGKGWL